MIELCVAGILFGIVLALNKKPRDKIERALKIISFFGLYISIVLLIIEVLGLGMIMLEVI